MYLCYTAVNAVICSGANMSMFLNATFSCHSRKRTDVDYKMNDDLHTYC